MSEDLTQLQLQESRRALSLCTGERDRAREEARQLRGQLRALRAELQAVRPVEQVELLAAQEALREAQAQAAAATAKQLAAERERDQAQDLAARAETQTKQARMESDMSLERVIELREQLARIRSNRAIDEAAVSLLRAQLDAVRSEAPEPVEAEPAQATQQEPPQAQHSAEAAAAAPEKEALALAGEASNEQPTGDPQQDPEETQQQPNPDFDLPEGAIWEFEGAAEPEHFMALCLELCKRAAGDYLRIGHFEGLRKERQWSLVVMAGPEDSVRDFLVALDREHMRLMSATGLPLVRIQPSRWSSNVLDANSEEVVPLRYAKLQSWVVDGTLQQQEGGQ
jgi:hypothetical protein